MASTVADSSRKRAAGAGAAAPVAAVPLAFTAGPLDEGVAEPVAADRAVRATWLVKVFFSIFDFYYYF
jgi:hypothetical protein